MTTTDARARVLVTGWFSFLDGEATAGDLLAMHTVVSWLQRHGIAHDVALSPVFHSGVDLTSCDPDDYTAVVFVCGPVVGSQVERLREQFAAQRFVAIGVSSVVAAADLDVDVLLERDSDRMERPDLSLAAPRELVPVVAVVRAHAQPEHARARHADAHAAIDAALGMLDVGVLELDTRVDPRQPGIHSSAAVESRLIRADAVISTRLHGAVLALKHGVPAVAVDPIGGGAKVGAQMRALSWPFVHAVDDIDAEAIARDVRRCLEPDGRARASQVRPRALEALDGLDVALAQAVRGEPRGSTTWVPTT